MARVVILGITGEEGLWVVDLDAGTAAPLTNSADASLQPIVNLRAAGATVTKGVNVAVTVKSADSAYSGHFDG
ncbi:hypothetical protein HGP17_07355 [Rhizobium sp. P38BS-XIX]|uniref:hypothetical protein n=1 Tax=Rhizobium sp. P38BS-XIX TaxID=2726740 RepID=UPI001456C888|nr:hypothetical protein [Rhizobium sp. P38BS-XIX]NLR96648.1 hypothetical protein [Rhizobium sp. P38BS-XIX]